MKPCPYCEGYMSDDDHSISLVETHVNNFENSQAAECDHCGLRAMSADINDGDELAFKFWDDLVDSINDNTALRTRAETAERERDALAELWRDYAEFLVDNEVAMAFCPVCKGEQSRGHEDDCELAVALAKGAKEVCPSCTWRCDVELVNGVCPQCDTDWHKLRNEAA